MICANCKEQKHETCKEENKDRDYSSCDCLHRTNIKTIVISRKD